MTLDERFEVFWKAYPRKKDKGHARKAWCKLKPDEDLLNKMLTALAWQKRSQDWRKEGGKFIPYPGTWLNGERWHDEPTIEVVASRECVYQCYECSKQRVESQMERHPKCTWAWRCKGGCK